MGVETVNTNNDEDLNRLNELLKHYQWSKQEAKVS
jgi:hypothetical protein